MYPKKTPCKYKCRVNGSSISSMLHCAKKVLTEKQYKELQQSVNGTAGYADQKGLIYASIQAKQKKQRFRKEDT